MPAIHHGTPGGSLTENGEAKYGSAGRAGAHFERRVAAALDHWLDQRSEQVHVFHDLTGLDTHNPTLRRSLALGTANIDHVILLGRGWIMLDAKGVGQGQLRVEKGKGVLVTPVGDRRPQRWMDTASVHAHAGALHDLTGGKNGVAVWVLPDGVDYSHPTVPTARCFIREKIDKLVLSVSELSRGDLETVPELRPPFESASPQDVKALATLVR